MTFVNIAVVFSMVLIDCFWAMRIGFSVQHVLGLALKIGAVALAGGAYLRLRPNARLAEMLAYVMLWLVFSAAAAVMTYLAASLAYPLQDSFYRHADIWLHFDLRAVTLMLQSSSLVWRALNADYFSLLFQISVTVLWLAHTRTRGRNAAFLAGAIMSFLVCCIISGILPAIGPSQVENPSLTGPPSYVTDILAMRSGLPVSKTVEGLEGIICFPSYHSVLAVLIIWSHRRLATFWPMMVINLAMLVSVPSVGNHYLTDLLGGFAAVCASIVTVGYCHAWRSGRTQQMVPQMRVVPGR